MSRQRKIFSRLIAVIIILSTVLIPGGAANAANKSYLVMIETQKGQWTAYKDMICVSPNGAAMLKATEFCDAAGFDYTSGNSTKTFSIRKNTTTYNLYKLDSKAYTYYQPKNVKTSKNALNNAYYDKTAKSNLCEASSVATICSMKAFASTGTLYGNLKFSDILCYSKYSAVKTLPDIKKVLYEDSKQVYDPVPVYKSPDGMWSAKMYSMDGTINSTKKLWPSLAKGISDDFLTGDETQKIEITLDPDHYDPFNYGARVPYITITIEENAKPGVTYTKQDFGVLGFIVEDSKVVDITTSGAFNIYIAPTNMGISGSWSSYDKEEVNYFKEVTLRLDTLDREKGIVIGYVKIAASNSYNNVNVEGYFAEKYINDTDRPTDSEIYAQLHPKTTTDKSTAGTGSGGSSVSSGSSGSGSTVKLPTLQNIPCPTCGGTGKITCSVCHGVGYSQHMGYQYGQYGLIVDPCMACGGAGGRLCSTCGGSGMITKLSP